MNWKIPGSSHKCKTSFKGHKLNVLYFINQTNLQLPNGGTFINDHINSFLLNIFLYPGTSYLAIVPISVK